MPITYEKVETINRRLHDIYSETANLPNFRIVWSEDQFEMRRTNFTDEGFELIHPEVRNLPKYRQWIQRKYVLERLTVVPYVNEADLPDSKLSYEPIWVFEDAKGDPITPAWAVTKFIIDGIHKAMAEAGVYTKYPDKNETVEQINDRLQTIQDSLFENESNVGDALATKNAISMAGLDGRSKK
jgi:hypothetical protein